MRALLILFTILSTSLSVQASDWIVKSRSCSTGRLNRTFEVGYVLSSEDARSFSQGQGRFIESENDAVITAVVTGDDSGACENGNKPAILTIVLDKKN
jgi:hypothetical protein